MSDKKKLKAKEAPEAPEAPSKPTPKDEPPKANQDRKFRPGVHIKPTFHRIDDESGSRNCVTLASKKDRLVEMGLYFDMDPTAEKRFVLALSIPSDLEGGRDHMKIDRAGGDEAQALWNAFPRRIPDWELPDGCGLEPAPERTKKKRKVIKED